jgi:hypothetical protein
MMRDRDPIQIDVSGVVCTVINLGLCFIIFFSKNRETDFF